MLEHFTSGCNYPSAMIIHFFQVNPSMIYQVDLLYGFFSFSVAQYLFYININLILEHFTSGCNCPSAVKFHIVNFLHASESNGWANCCQHH